MATEWYVHIVEVKSGITERKIGPSSSEHDAQQVEKGICINLDHSRYFTCVRSEPDPSDRKDVPRCSQCGVEQLEMIEGALLVREVMGRNEDGELIINSSYTVYDEGAENPRIMCKCCGHSYDLGEDTQVQFVN